MLKHILSQTPGFGMVIGFLVGGVAVSTALAAGQNSTGEVQITDSSVKVGGGNGAEPAAEPASVEAPAERTPLMELFDMAGLAQPMDEIGLTMSGWVETSFTGILHGPGGSRAGLPLRVYEANKPDNAKMNQLAIVIDRSVDKSKPIDLGFHVTPLYGADSRVNAAVGLFDHETHTHSFDLLDFYARLWIKTAENQGLEVIFGKWVTTVGAEVIPSPSNWMASRSMLFGYGPFTHTGVLAKYWIGENFNAHFGVSRGWDQFKDNNHGASWHAGFYWASEETLADNARDVVNFAFIAGPEEVTNTYGGQNRYIWDANWTHVFTEKLTGVLDTYYTLQCDAEGAVSSNGGVHTRDTGWYGLAYMVKYDLLDNLYWANRAEWFADKNGVRTGYRGNFYSMTTGFGYTPFPEDRWLNGLLLRPEFRLDTSDNNDPFVDDGCQMTAAISVVYSF